MANNIIVRTAKKDYVCDCCGKIIKTGTEYLDKVVLNNGTCVRHERYHDECPKDEVTELFQQIKDAKYLLPISVNGTKYWATGINAGLIMAMDWETRTRAFVFQLKEIER